MISAYVISLLLIGLSGVLIDSHRRSWRNAQNDDELTDRDRRFARSQYLRRMQASAIIGFLGASIGLLPIVPRTPLWMTSYLAILIGTCGAICLLAILDVVASRQFYRRLRNEEFAAQAKLAHQMRAGAKTPKNEG